MPVEVASFLIPKNGNAWFVLEDKYFRGGFRVVADDTERLAINSSCLKPGMLVMTADNSQIWKLSPDLVSWTTVGLEGPQGPQGEPGLTGAQGPQGLQGIQGEQGPQGLAGADGAVGPKGLDGADGQSLTINALGAFSELATYDSEALGFCFLAEDQQQIYVKRSAAAGDWSDPIPYGVGEAGPQGPVGPQGPQGEQGPQGIQGETGSQGDVGLSLLYGEGVPAPGLGRDGEFYIDSLNHMLYGPKAGAWPAGVSTIGPEGPQGQRGLTGPGAYQAWLDAGNSGTEADFLLTIKGPQGNEGPVGPAGTPGNLIIYDVVDPLSAVGRDGDFFLNTATKMLFGPRDQGAWPAGTSIVGPQGPQGIKGDTGAQGPQGLQGEQGLQGPAGTDGVDGTNGTNGNLIIYDAVDPAPGVGSDGDFYINTSTNTLFGPKDGSWPAGVSLVGPQGPQGEQGVQGIQGEQGPQGNVVGGTINGDVTITGKTYFRNIFSNFASLPDATANEGMFATTEDTNKAYFANDGTWVELAIAQTAVIPYDISFGVPGNMAAASELSGIVVIARTVALNMGLPGSIARARVAPLSTVVYDLQVNGVSKASITFAAGSVNGTFTMAANLNLVAGDVVELFAPATLEANIKSVGITLVGRAQAPQGTMAFA